MGKGRYEASVYSTSITTFGLSIFEGAPFAPLLTVLGLKGYEGLTVFPFGFF